MTAVNSGKKMFKFIAREVVDLLLLEPGLPGEDGLTLTKNVRESSSIAIRAAVRAQREVDRVMNLELGADDYVTKPFSPRELLARIQTVLRRSKLEIDAWATGASFA